MSVTKEYARSPNCRRGNTPSARAGFTILELLTVIAIIGVLVGMVATAAYHVRIAAMQSNVNKELSLLSQSVEAYRMEMGEYPPDGTNPDQDLVKRHMLKVFHYTGEPPTVEPCTALVFWLGGMRNDDGIPIGFSDSKKPFDVINKNRIGPFFNFAPERLLGGSYYPEGFNVSDEKDSYVYFRSENGDYTGKAGCCGDKPTQPYMNTKTEDTEDWVNPDSFQIHSPGLDGVHGNSTQYPDGPYEEVDLDDQTNFSGGPLKNKMP